MLACILVGAFPNPRGAFAQDPNVVLRLEALEDSAASFFQADVRFDNFAVNDWYGWSFGVCHDSALIELLDVDDGETTLTVNGGQPPGFSALESVPDEGFAAGVVIDLFGLNTLGPGVDYHFNRATYFATGPGTTADLCFCDSIGTPPFAVVIVGSGASIVPTQVCASVELQGPFPSEDLFVFSLGTTTGTFDLWGGAGRFDVDLAIGQELPGGVVPQATNGFTMCLRHDPTLLEAVGVAPIGPLAALVDPAFFDVDLLPEGACVEVQYDMASAQELFFPVTESVVRVTYETVPEELELASLVETIVLWDDSLGATNSVLTATGESRPALLHGVLTLTGEARSYRRADCNSDGAFNVGDVVHILGTLFGSIVVPCRQSCDVNGDFEIDIADAISMVGYLFQGGSPPAAPFPDCTSFVGQHCVLGGSCP